MNKSFLLWRTKYSKMLTYFILYAFLVIFRLYECWINGKYRRTISLTFGISIAYIST